MSGRLRINDEHPLCKQTGQRQKSAGAHPKPSQDREDYIRRPLVNPQSAATGGEGDSARAAFVLSLATPRYLLAEQKPLQPR